MDLNKKLSSIQEVSKAQLSKILSVNPNTKHLVLEPAVIRPLEKVCGVKWLKGNGVEKIFKLEPAAPNFDTNAVFYMIFSTTVVFRQVVDQIRSQINNIEAPVKNKFHIVVITKYSYNFEVELEELGLLNAAIKLHSFQWMPIHLDVGILSLEVPHVYSQLFVHNDTALLPTLSKIIWQLFFVVGKPKFTIALGQFANAILRQYDDLCEDRGDTDKLESDFGALVIIDRNMDYPSALLTPGIYSALLNEVYGVKAGICGENKPDSGVAAAKLDCKSNPVVARHPVNFSLDSSQDSVYADIKNRHFTEVISVLGNLTKQLKSEKMSSKEMALDEIKRYVQTQLQATKSRKKFITNHLLAAESIVDVLGPRYENLREIEQNIMRNSNKSTNVNYLDEILTTENDQLISLRLFCLLCITQKLSGAEVKTFWRKYLHQFGFQYGFALRGLRSAGFVMEMAPQSSAASKIVKIPMFSTNNFYANAKNLRQIPAEPDKLNLKYPTCASYVYGGSYIPLITQICSLILNSVPIEEIKSKLECFGGCTMRNDRGYPLQSRTILVYVIGGVTYAEVAACNMLEILTGSRIFILSDKVITGNDLMRGLLDFPK